MVQELTIQAYSELAGETKLPGHITLRQPLFLGNQCIQTYAFTKEQAKNLKSLRGALLSQSRDLT